jgi:hypothetical protein
MAHMLQRHPYDRELKIQAADFVNRLLRESEIKKDPWGKMNSMAGPGGARKGKGSPDEADGPVFITLKEFAYRISVSEPTAREIAQRKALNDLRISTRIAAEGKRGHIRINWPRYLKYIEENPAVPEAKYTRREEGADARGVHKSRGKELAVQ